MPRFEPYHNVPSQQTPTPRPPSAAAAAAAAAASAPAQAKSDAELRLESVFGRMTRRFPPFPRSCH